MCHADREFSNCGFWSYVGFIVEVDNAYPEELHDTHNVYLLAPETISILKVWLSPYQRNLMNELGGKFTVCAKLVPNLHHKERYVLHYRNLKLYHELGKRMTKIHRAL